MEMKRHNLLLILILFLFVGCAQIKNNINIFSKNKKNFDPEEITLVYIEELRIEYIQGDIGAIEKLINIYKDKNINNEIRKSAVRSIAETRHPLALEAIAEYVRTSEAIDIDLMITSVGVLSKFEEDPIASNSLMESIFTVDKKLREVQSATFKSLKNVKPKNKVLALIDIYERSRAAYYSTATMVSNTLGSMDDDEVIPVLIFISKDESLDIKVRNRAIEILASNKNDYRVIEMFTEMLTEPSTQDKLKDFALNTMKDVKEERLILALMDTYNQGQASYYSLLGTLLDALGNFNDPVILPTLVEIAMDNDIPRNLRIKSINGLGNFKSSNTFELILPMLEDPSSYEYYPYIIELAHQLGVHEKFKTQIRNAGLVAQEKALEKNVE